MSLAVIEINDLGVEFSVEGGLVGTSPGFAVMDGDHLLLGKEGQENARLLPRWSNNQFWDQLSTDPVALNIPGIRHQADLAFAHLEKIWQDCIQTSDTQPDEVLLVVPGYFSNEQLSLLLGMAREVDIPVSAMTDVATLSLCNQSANGRILHLDASLHRISLSVLQADTFLQKQDTVSIHQGIHHFREKWASVIARQMIESSRFDPLHQALSEQKMFDLIPEWVKTIDTSDSIHPFELSVADNVYNVNISTDQLLSASADIYPQITKMLKMECDGDQSIDLFVSHRLADIPGVRETLGLVKNIQEKFLEPDVLHTNALNHKDELRRHEAGVTFIAKIPINAEQKKTANITPLPPTKESDGSARPTHLLYQSNAIRIKNSMNLSSDFSNGLKEGSNPFCTIDIDGDQVHVESHRRGKLMINHEVMNDRNLLCSGDTIQFNDKEIQLITLRE